MSRRPALARRDGRSVPGGFTLTVAALAAAGHLVCASEVGARCTRSLEFRQFVASAGRALRCRQHRLTDGPGAACHLLRAPACAGTAADDAAALVYGTPNTTAVDGQALRPQVVCQAAIARASTLFLFTRLRERANGERAERTSRASFQVLLARCGVGVADDPGGSGVRLPLLGSPCAASVTTGGAAVDRGALVQCLRPALERIVDQVAATHLRPNVVLINTDDQRWDTLWAMPTIQELASKGVAFTNSFVTSPLCAPSRSSLFTGRYAHDTGVLDTGGPQGGAHVFDDSSTIATWLKAAGYHTGHFGKYMNGYFAISPHIPPGWDDFRTFYADIPLYFDYDLVENGIASHHGSSAADYSTDVLAGMTRDFMDAHANEPFFAYYAPFAPHTPPIPAPRHAGLLGGLAPWRPPSYNYNVFTGVPGWVVLQAFLWRPANQPTNDQFRIDSLETLFAVDEAVDGFLARLAELGLDDDTVVIFTSDNGYAWGEHWWWGKECGYEECLRVPLVIRDPGAPYAPRQEAGLVSNLDLAPTIAELAEATTPANVNGQSLVGLLNGTAPAPSDVLGEYWVRAIPIIPTWRSLRTDQWKYIHNYNTSDFLQLYDLTSDPYELANKAYDPAYADLVLTFDARVDVLFGQ
jgi:N-acetylglucosamine-6-sulfatase